MANVACTGAFHSPAGVILPGSDGVQYTVKPGAVTMVPDAQWVWWAGAPGSNVAGVFGSGGGPIFGGCVYKT